MATSASTGHPPDKILIETLNETLDKTPNET